MVYRNINDKTKNAKNVVIKMKLLTVLFIWPTQLNIF